MIVTSSAGAKLESESSERASLTSKLGGDLH
jgi:hypothetical protein